MNLLSIEHQDFTLNIECAKWEGIWEKAISNVKDENLYSTYSWSDGVESVSLTTDAEGVLIENGGKSKAIFFDNADYPIWVDFKNNVKDAVFGTELKYVQDNFSFHKKRHILSGFLNYGNDIGKSEINIVYKLEDGETKKFNFAYEVLSTKLNYHEHWEQIVKDIEEEYRMLSIDYLRRTFHSFKPDTIGETQEIIWWNIFNQEQEKFLGAIKHIIDRPRHKLRGNEIYLRADKLKRITPQIEKEFAEHNKENAHLYRTEEQMLSNDTMENRFLKYALTVVANKYDILKRAIEGQKISDTLKKKLYDTKIEMEKLRHHSFFRTIGPFKGLTQESQILQKASDYSQVYRTWCLLRKSYSLNDGMYRLQTKDIATLYEIWCFIEVSHIVKELLPDDAEVDYKNRMEMNGMFTWDLGRGENSRILFNKGGVQLAELIYNPKHTDKENDSVSIDKLVVKTVPQKPDIVLRLTKHDLEHNMKMTYLFDAKYRIDSKVNGVDTPPDDAINQMHRYRDAIYYQDGQNTSLKKEVIGGYILFPGYAKTKEDIEKTNFYKSINEVNIGAFPLRPKDEENRQLLVNFIEDLIHKASSEILDDSIPQKGLYYTTEEPKDAIYMILTIDTDVNNDIEAILEGRADTIIMGKKGPEETKDIQTIRYIAPIIPGSHIEGFYKVTKVNLKHINDAEYPIRIKFDVAEWKKLNAPAKFGMAKAAYRGFYKTRDEFLKHCESQKVIDKL